MASVSVNRHLSQEEHTRDQILRDVLLDGAAWEPDSGLVMDFVAGLIDADCVFSVNNTYAQKRLGAKRVNTLERIQSKGEILNPQEATLYRALAARANYLALDRPDVAFAT